jgi:hypothetical protein
MEDGRDTQRKFVKESLVPQNIKLDNFSVYSNRQSIARFMALQKLFELQLPIKGSIVECGVFQGGGLFTYANLSAIYEPSNYHRQIIGFDTFEGFPGWSAADKIGIDKMGNFSPGYDSFTELNSAATAFHSNQFIESKEKIRLIKGDANLTIPKFLVDNPYFICSMLYLDFDIYEPTKTAIEYFLPRMPKGAVIAFDEIHNPNWPGETQALIETIGLANLELRCFPFDPHVAYAVL